MWSWLEPIYRCHISVLERRVALKFPQSVQYSYILGDPTGTMFALYLSYCEAGQKERIKDSSQKGVLSFYPLIDSSRELLKEC